jgi:hypothetical protein
MHRKMHMINIKSCGLGLLCSLPIISADAASIQAAPIEGVQGAGVYAVDLTPAQMAQLSRTPNPQLQVLDSNNQPMPRRMHTVMQAPTERWAPLALYPWPSADPLTAEDVTSLQLQFGESGTQATLRLPHRAPLSAQMYQRQWLLVVPDTVEYQPNMTLRLDLDWMSQAQATDVMIEGSQDLLSWQSAGSGSLLQAKQNTGLTLKQNRLNPMGQYRYWRLTLTEPLPLSAAKLIMQQPAKPVTERQTVQFLPTQIAGQWQVDLGAVWSVQAMRWDIPINQVWAFNVQVQRPAAIGYEPTWYTVGEARLHHWAEPPAGESPQKEWLFLDQPTDGQIWRLTGQASSSTLNVELEVPKQQLLFLAQGQAPYRVQIGQTNNAAWSMQLPEQTPKTQAATLGVWHVVQDVLPWRQYGLWAVLVLVVLILAGVAWRLMGQLKKV